MHIMIKIFAFAIIAIAVFVVIKHRFSQQKKRHIHREPILDDVGTESVEPSVADEIAEHEVADAQLHISENNALLIEDESIDVDQVIDRPQAQNTGVICLSVLAKPGQAFQGYELLQTLLANGLRYGKMNIFHRHQEPNGKGPIVFSLASATEPGTFELSKMGGTTCQGLTLFMRVSGQRDLSFALETMIESAKQLAEDLQGMVVTEDLKPLSIEKTKEWRERIRAYEQGQQTADMFE